MAEQRLTLHDHLVVACLLNLTVPVVHKRKEEATWLEELRIALPSCNSDNPQIHPLYEAGKALVTEGAVTSGLHMRARFALEAFWRYRAALMIDAIQQAEQKLAG